MEEQFYFVLSKMLKTYREIDKKKFNSKNLTLLPNQDFTHHVLFNLGRYSIFSTRWV